MLNGLLDIMRRDPQEIEAAAAGPRTPLMMALNALMGTHEVHDEHSVDEPRRHGHSHRHRKFLVDSDDDEVDEDEATAAPEEEEDDFVLNYGEDGMFTDSDDSSTYNKGSKTSTHSSGGTPRAFPVDGSRRRSVLFVVLCLCGLCACVCVLFSRHTPVDAVVPVFKHGRGRPAQRMEDGSDPVVRTPPKTPRRREDDQVHRKKNRGKSRCSPSRESGDDY
jgi:hypothetical protein